MRIAVLGLVVACGDNITVPDQLASPFASGEVIRARLLVADEFSTLIGWQDTDRGYGCSLAHADGDCARPDPEQRFSEESCSLPLTRSDEFALITRDDRFYTVGLPYIGPTYTRSGGTCTVDPEVFSGFLLDPVERADLLQIRTPTEGTFEGTPYTATTTTDGSSLITDLGPDTVEDIAAAPSRLRQVFRLAGRIRMLELRDSLPVIYDAHLDHTCRPAHPYDASSPIRCVPDSDTAAENVFGNEQCIDMPPTDFAAPVAGFASSTADPDQDGIPIAGAPYACTLPLAGVWYAKQPDGSCALAGPAFECVIVDATEFAALSIEID